MKYKYLTCHIQSIDAHYPIIYPDRFGIFGNICAIAGIHIKLCGLERCFILQHAMLLMEWLGGFAGWRAYVKLFLFMAYNSLVLFSALLEDGCLASAWQWKEGYTLSLYSSICCFSIWQTYLCHHWLMTVCVLSQFSCCDNIRSALSVMTWDRH